MKTTPLGIVTIIAGLANAAVAMLNGQPVDIASLCIAITSGLGLIKAADAKK